MTEQGVSLTNEDLIHRFANLTGLSYTEAKRLLYIQSDIEHCKRVIKHHKRKIEKYEQEREQLHIKGRQNANTRK